MKRIICLISLFLSIGQFVFCQYKSGRLKFDLSIRYRFEVWNGMNAKNYGDDSPEAIGSLNDKILLQRIIPGVTYSGEKITAGFHFQDSRVFGWSLRDKQYPDLFKVRKTGTESPYYIMNPHEEFFEIYDLYIEYRDLLKNITVEAGRKKIFLATTGSLGRTTGVTQDKFYGWMNIVQWSNLSDPEIDKYFY